MSEDGYRSLPSVDRVLRQPRVRELLTTYRREAVVHLIRRELESARVEIDQGGQPRSLDTLAGTVHDVATESWVISPRRVINATGVVLHTNAGRAPLSRQAIGAVVQVAGYSNLEVELSRGERGSRQEHVCAQITSLTGAETAHVTVNAASAVLLALAAVAKGREVIVSRGQSVEIGGGFRVPVILRQSGAKLVEVGTTNRTRLSDYQEAISPRTAAILHVHSSNFRIVGFTQSVELPDLATLAHERDLLLIADNGSGALLDTEQFGLAHEPTVQESVAAGCDLVAFSGDKLLGGPQAGVLVGRREPMSKLSSHPLARALRPDKLILAALSATFAAYLKDEAVQTIPIWQMISQTQDQLDIRSHAWAKRAARRGVEVEVVIGESTVGGGSLPAETLPTALLVLPPRVSATDLRHGQTPVLARTRSGRVLLDLRTVSVSEEEELFDAVFAALNGAEGVDGRANEPTST